MMKIEDLGGPAFRVAIIAKFQHTDGNFGYPIRFHLMGWYSVLGRSTMRLRSVDGILHGGMYGLVNPHKSTELVTHIERHNAYGGIEI